MSPARGAALGGVETQKALALWAAVHGIATVATLAPGLDTDALVNDVVGGLITGWSP